MMANVMTLTNGSISSQDISGQFCPPPRFLSIRNLLLGCIFSLSLVWSILLCIAIFAQWISMNNVEHNMISIMLFIEFFTIILVPILLAREFRLWLDAARCLFLFASHFGVAVWFACQAPSMKCVAGNEQAVCSSLILSILIFSWVIPALVVLYSCGLGYLYYRLSKVTHPVLTVTATSTMPHANDAEKHQKTVSHSSFHESRHVSRASSGYAV